MENIYRDIVIEIEPGEEERVADLIRTLQQLPRRRPHPRGRGIARWKVNTTSIGMTI